MAQLRMLPGLRLPVRVGRFFAVLAATLLMAWTGPGLPAQQPPVLNRMPAPAPRILVKVRPALARAIEASQADPTGAVVQGIAGDPLVAGFLGPCPSGRLTALHPGLIDRRKAGGLDDAQVVDQLRQRFPRRMRHVPRPIPAPEVSRTYVLDAGEASPAQVQALAARLAADPQVEFAEVEHVASACFSANDPYLLSTGSWGQAYADLWGLADIGAPAAWDLSTGSGILVAVIDTGIDAGHPDIASKVVPGWDFVGSSHTSPVQGPDPVDRYGHGTHVAGTIAAAGNNGIGIIGVAPDARIMALKALDDGGYGASASLAQAIIYAADHGADVINASWAGAGTDSAIAEAIQYAASVGVVFVAAAGNAGQDAASFYPGNSPEAITVASLGPGNRFSGFSNSGRRIDVTAPGEYILSLRAAGTSRGTLVAAGYATDSGTSMAAPHVAGLVALLLAREPDAPIEAIRQRIRASATRTSPDGWDAVYGYGILDARGALALASALQVRITAPADGRVVSGAVPVTGTAQGPSFVQYRLEYGAGECPSSWVTLQSSSTPVAAGTLGTFHADQVPDGAYTIRLTATDSLGGSYTDRTEIQVAYLGITDPLPPQTRPAAVVFKPGARVPILGTATGPSFQGFRIQWAQGVNPASGWSTAGVQLAGAGAAPISAGQLGTWDTTGIAEADDYTVRLLVDNQGFTSQFLTLVRLEPALYSQHWPQPLPIAPSFQSGLVPVLDESGRTTLVVAQPRYLNVPGSPALVRFSPDGASRQEQPLAAWTYFNPTVGPLGASTGQDLVTPEPEGAVTVWHADGSTRVLQPAADLGDLTFAQSQIVMSELGSGTGRDVVALGQARTDGGTTYLFAWHPDGSLLGARFPIIIPDLDPRLISQAQAPRVLVGDLDGDGIQDFVVAAGTSSSSFTLVRYDRDGASIPWAVPEFSEAEGTPSLCDLALADLDHNRRLETLMIAGGRLHVFQPDGSERGGWPQALIGSTGHLAVGDLDQDGSEEIVVTSGGRLMAYRTDGTPFSDAWPQWAASGRTTRSEDHPILADVDGDGRPEILGTCYSVRQEPPVFADAGQGLATRGIWFPDPVLVAVRMDGSVARSWQLRGMGGCPPYQLAVLTVGDFDRDGLTEIAITFYNDGLWLTAGAATVLATGTPWLPSANPWPMLYHDPAHTATRAGLVLYPGVLPPMDMGMAYSQQLGVGGGRAPYTFSVTSGSLPPGLALSTAGLLSGILTQPGAYAFRITARDQGEATVAVDYRVTVQGLPITLLPYKLPVPVVGAAYEARFFAGYGLAPYTYAVTSGRLPSGLALSQEGRLSGTCSSVGQAAFAVTATDSNGTTGMRHYTVTPICPEIALSPATLPVPEVGGAYAVQFAATGGSGPYAYALADGSLPAGLTLTGAGLLSGACSTGGSARFQVTAIDRYGCAGSQGYTLQVADPVVQASVAQAGLLPGRPAVFTVSLAGLGDPAVTWTASGGTLVPSGLSATFSADVVGTYTITAASAAAPQAAATITVAVHGAGFSRPDGTVCGLDALLLIGALGEAGTAQDLDGNDRVDATDLDLLLDALGW